MIDTADTTAPAEIVLEPSPRSRTKPGVSTGLLLLRSVWGDTPLPRAERAHPRRADASRTER